MQNGRKNQSIKTPCRVCTWSNMFNYLLFRNHFHVTKNNIKLVRLMNGVKLGDWLNELITPINITIEVGFSYIALKSDLTYEYVEAQRGAKYQIQNQSQWLEMKQMLNQPYSRLIQTSEKDKIQSAVENIFHTNSELIPLAPVACTLWLRVPPC